MNINEISKQKLKYLNIQKEEKDRIISEIDLDKIEKYKGIEARKAAEKLIELHSSIPKKTQTDS